MPPRFTMTERSIHWVVTFRLNAARDATILKPPAHASIATQHEVPVKWADTCAHVALYAQVRCHASLTYRRNKLAMTTGRMLKLRRNRLGYTLEDIAAKLSVSSVTISRIEKGEPSSFLNLYKRLLEHLRLERLREEIRALPLDAWKFVGEIYNERDHNTCDGEDDAPAQLATV
ncbi:helix-turn-helix domain-containing protein [Amycolatopsis jejuensis]|uniref:helix-turn-helix domain-containing protein n=1 Tax=Amycolatopsis jejuensis TaxID=330084 RepID=UPI000A0684CA